jgi:hypothetical protein
MATEARRARTALAVVLGRAHCLASLRLGSELGTDQPANGGRLTVKTAPRLLPS